MDANGVPNTASEYIQVINWLNTHAGYSVDWDWFRSPVELGGHADMADLTNQIQIAISGGTVELMATRVWLYFGGNYDTRHNRSPGDPWATSVQKLGADVLAMAKVAGTPTTPLPFNSNLPVGYTSPTLPGGSTALGGFKIPNVALIAGAAAILYMVVIRRR